MKEFFITMPTRVYFGTNILEDSLKKEVQNIKNNILIVTTGRSLIRHGHLDKVIASLKQVNPNINIQIFDKISPNPRLEEVKEAVSLGKDYHVEQVIGFGGGSALDAAKAVAVGIPVDEQLENYLIRGKTPSQKTLPIIAIPTTAGTGSELSKGAIISSQEHQIKTGIRGEYLLPQIAIVDTCITWTLPKRTSLEVGFDVLAHAIETYVAAKANVYSAMLSEKAIRIVGKALPELYSNLENHEAREQMCFASMIMGSNLASVGTCLPHRMQYVIGAKTDTSHAAGLIALYPAWISHEFEVNQDKINNILVWLGYQPAVNKEHASGIFYDFMKSLELTYRLKDLGIEKSEVEGLADQVIGNISNDLLSQQKFIMDKIFTESY